jgi:hypothetical protein
VELTKRQQALRDKTLAQRHATARDMIAAYHQKKTDEQAKRNADVAERREQRLERETKIKEAKAEAYINYQNAVASKNVEEAAYWKTKAECLEKGMPLEEAKQKAEIAKINAQAAASSASAEASRANAEKTKHDDERAAAGKTETKEVEKTDKKGTTKTKETTTTKPAEGQGNTTSPPSRRATDNNTNNDNTPPSRRKK